MKLHKVRVARSADRLPREAQLAWKLAEVAADPAAALLPESLPGIFRE